MRDRLAAVAGDLEIDPVESELATHDRLCAGSGRPRLRRLER